MSSTRFHLLDGLRGYAALVVVLTHMMGFFHHTLPVEAGLLAVDLFFVMSGLVIAMNYDHKLRSGEMSLPSFMRRRLVRLYPVYILGAVIGLIFYLGTAPDGLARLPGTSLSALTMLPQFLFGIQGATFDYNTPAWSLSLEIYGNLLFALFAIRLPNRALAATALIAAIVFAIGAAKAGTLNIGPHANDFFLGFARFWYSFAVGILIWRWREYLPRFGIAGPVIVVIAMLFPALPAGDLLRFLWVILVMPLAVIAASQIHVGKRTSQFCDHLGRMSYPVYIIHQPVIRLTTAILAKFFGQAMWSNPLAGAIGLLAALIATVVATYWVEPPLRAAFAKLTGGTTPRIA